MRVLALLLPLAACSEGGGDTGSPDGTPSDGTNGNGTTDAANDPPDVGSDEAALVVHDSGSDAPLEVRCARSDASSGFNVSAGPVPGGTGELLLASCAIVDPATSSFHSLQLVVTEASLSPGTYDIAAGTSYTDADGFAFQVVVDGEGIELPYTMNGGITFEGTLTVEENGGSGGAFRATWIVDYPRLNVVTGGVATETVDRPGTAAGAIDVTLP